MDEWYTPAEVARMLKVSKETVMRQLRAGKLQGMKVGRLWRIPGSVLQVTNTSTSDRRFVFKTKWEDENGNN